MKFKDIIQKHLLTEGRTKSISKERAKEIYQNNCFNFSERHHFWRGMNSDIDFGLIEPIKYNRKSTNSKNYVNILTEVLPSWRGYPERTRSVIGSTHSGYSKEFGDIYRVIPFNKSEIAIIDEFDFWFMPNVYETTQIYRTSGLDKSLHKTYWSIKEKGLNTASSYELRHQLQELDLDKYQDKIDQFLETTLRGASFVYAWKESGKNMFDFLDSVLDPKKNKISLIDNSSNTSDKNNELWTDGKCLLIKEELTNDFLNEV